MKQIWGGALSIALLAASPNASAQHGHYFFQHQTSITETTNGCILSILYPEQGPLSFEYMPKQRTVEISYQLQRAEPLIGDNLTYSFILNGSDPRPDATEADTYQGYPDGSAQAADGHLKIRMTADNSADLLEFMARSYSISFNYYIVGDDSEASESYDYQDISDLVAGLKKCAEAVSARKS